MRPIKFRAWTGKKIISWGILRNLKTVMLSLILEWGHRDYIPMQFTGLLDKNGKEIYEGDIVKIEDQFWGVYRDESYLEYFIMNGESNEPMYSYAHYEVVGNIYENPELVNA
ncbi:hypothetical protein BSK20_03655 [SR1 bacterium human oral taxon HOT-345]|nr:hypothetical protein BSK20_03655 [SR1 bacterium human oral taxon HOT-345]